MQWTADRQLAAAKDLAHELGMKVGLYLDVAVGVFPQSDGFDAWNEQVAISRQLGVGATPDPLNTAGQSWGLAGSMQPVWSNNPSRRLPKCCARRCGMPARSGSTTCWA